MNGLSLGQDLTLRSITDRGWTATLLVPAAIDGKQCAAGPLRLTDTGGLRACVLRTATQWPFGIVPAGTSYDRSEVSGATVTTLTLGYGGMTLPPSGVALPAQAQIELYRMVACAG